MEALFFLLGKACVSVALVAGIPLLITSCMSMLVAVAQTVTQIQEQSLTYVTKLCTMAAVFFCLGRFLFECVMAFFNEIFSVFTNLGVLA